MRKIWKDGRKKAMKRKGVNIGNYHKGPSEWKKGQRQKRRSLEKQAMQQDKDIPKVSLDYWL